MGDAAHTMTPVTGQGCNSGLEDAHIFADVLREEKDLAEALPKYNAARLPDVAALVRLNEVLAFGRFGVLVHFSRDVSLLALYINLLGSFKISDLQAVLVGK